jgi:type VII secretion integral membrane protein EccD
VEFARPLKGAERILESKDDWTAMATPPSSPGTSVNSLLRISVTSNDRRLDIGIPTTTPLAELVPGFARNLGVLDPTLVYGGYTVHRADGQVLEPERSLAAQGVSDGDFLTLVTGALQPEPRVYDDVVEAVADAIASQNSPWTAQDSARTALAASTAFLLTGAILLLAASSDAALGSLIAGAAAVLIVAAGAVLSRLRQPLAGHVLALTASVFGAVCGFLAVPSSEPWGWAAAAAGGGALAAGVLGTVLVPTGRTITLVPAAAGLVLGIAGSITALSGAEPSAVYGLTLALAATLGNGLPWLALSSTRIAVISPQTEQEIFADPPPIDAAKIKAQYNAGQQVLLACRAALGLVALATTPLVTGSGLAGTILCALCFVGTMLASRRTFARAEVLVIMGTGILGLLLTGVSAAVLHADWRPALVVALGIVAAFLVGLTLLSTKPSVRLGRIADGVDLVALTLLLPLGVTVAGLA